MHSCCKSQARSSAGRPRCIKFQIFHTLSSIKVVCDVIEVGIWERDEGILDAVARRLPPSAARLRSGRHPAELAEGVLDLLVVSPGALGWAGAGAVDCRTVLLPGGAGPLARALRTGQAVSYGTSPRDTLTFSSLEGDRICLALQRELVTLQGTVVEQQAMVLPFPPEVSPLPFLATAGTLLLLGMPPEQLMALPTGGP